MFAILGPQILDDLPGQGSDDRQHQDRLSDDHSGIIILADDAPLGKPVTREMLAFEAGFGYRADQIREEYDGEVLVGEDRLEIRLD